MADFSAVIRKTLDGMENPTPEMRAKVYERARGTITRQIEAMATRPPKSAVDRQFQKLDQAIAVIEEEFAGAGGTLPIEDELDHIFEEAPPAVKAAETRVAPAAPQQAETAADGNDGGAVEIASPADLRAEESETDPLTAFLAEQDEVEGLLGETEPAVPTERRPPVSRPATIGFEEPEIDSVRLGAAENNMMPVPPPQRRGALIGAIVLLIAVIGGGFAAYFNQDSLMALLGSEPAVTETVENGIPVRAVPSTTVTVDDTDVTPVSEDPNPIEDEGVSEDAEPQSDEPLKFTQRLTEDGREVDDGPAGAPDTSGEGTSVAGQTDTGDGAAADLSGGTEEPAVEEDTAPASLPVGQRAIFYQERTGAQAGTAEAGATIWSVVQESPGGDAPVEPAIHAESSIPELGLTMEMTIRRNADETFPASHVIELFFRVPNTFEGRGIADVQRITFKGTEQDPGNALIGVAAPLDTNIFLIALTDADTAIETNLNLMQRQKWIDIPMQYVSGRRALITLEKGIPGEQIFKDVLAQWAQAPLN